MSTALEHLRRYLDARDFIPDHHTIGSSLIGPPITFADLREIAGTSSEDRS